MTLPIKQNIGHGKIIGENTQNHDHEIIPKNFPAINIAVINNNTFKVLLNDSLYSDSRNCSSIMGLTLF